MEASSSYQSERSPVINVQDLFTEPPEVVEKNRLDHLQRFEDEYDKDGFLSDQAVTAIKQELDNLNRPGESELNRDEIKSVLSLINHRNPLGWKHSFYGRRQCLFKVFEDKVPVVDSDALETDYRVVGRKGNMLVIFADRIHADELKLVLDWEKDLKAKSAENTPAPKPLSEKLSDAHKLRHALTEEDRRFLSLQHLNDKEIAAQMGSLSQTTRLSRIRQKIGLHSAYEIISYAVAAGLIDLGTVPRGRRSVHDLSKTEQEALVCYRGGHFQTAEAAQSSTNSINRRFASIRTKLGVNNDRHAYLLAIKEELVPKPEFETQA